MRPTTQELSEGYISESFTRLKHLAQFSFQSGEICPQFPGADHV